MMKLKVWGLASLVFLQIELAYAEDQMKTSIGNLLIDQTYSLSGQIFYRQFSQYWYLYGIKSDVNVVISEENTTGSACFLSVLVNQKAVYKTKVTPNKIYSTPIWKTAASRVSNHLRDMAFTHSLSLK